MHSSSIWALFAVALPSVSAVLYASNATNVSTTTTTTNTTTALTNVPTGEYYLVTQVITPGCEDKNGLYVTGYHTGAGFNDVTLESIDVASKGFLNDTYQQFDFDSDFPWGMQMGNDINYASWEPAMIDGGYGSTGFYFNASGLQWNETDGGFIGWLACDWYHNVPQLFWIFYEYPTTLPCSCAQVNLIPQSV